VKVTVKDTAGLSSTATALVAVEAPAGDAAPAAALTVSPAAGIAPLTVTADASGSTDADSTPISTYTFDFGDGSVVGPQAGATAGHVYTAAGSFTVTLTVTDSIGLRSTTSATVTVQVDLPPAASLKVSPSNGRVPLTVTADASESATPAVTFREVEVEFDGDVPGTRIEAMVEVLVGAGARAGDPRSKIERSLALLGRR